MNEFCATMLNPEYYEIVEVQMQEPNWDRAFIRYRSKKPIQQLEAEELERVKKEQEKQYTDEDLKAIADENKRLATENGEKLEYDEPPPKVDKTLPVEYQEVVMDWMTNMLVGKEVIKRKKKKDEEVPVDALGGINGGIIG